MLTVVFRCCLSIQLLLGLTRADICQDAICEYEFEVHSARTMMVDNGESIFDVEWNGTDLVIVANKYRIPERHADSIGSVVDADDFITADYYPRTVIAINGQMPGPTIEVMEGAQVVVTVKNKLITDAVSIHWHGMHQKGTPFMDGAGFITQCPIQPSQTFTYRFKAEPAGTHWYHGHLANQRAEGLFGMIIVHKQLPTLPEIAVTVTDWWKQDGSTLDVFSPYRFGRKGSAQLSHFVFGRDYSTDSVETSSLIYQSTLLGGRGRWDDEEFPLREYSVASGQTHRFRLVNAAMELSYEISVDGHALRLVALDGQSIVPLEVDSFMVHPGERVDFELEADQPPDRYWMRARTVREGTGFDAVPDGVVQGTKAIIVYDTASTSGDPTTTEKQCTTSAPCKVFGCPFDQYPVGDPRICFHLDDTFSDQPHADLENRYGLNADSGELEEKFFNFAYVIGSSVNARRSLTPRAPLTQKHGDPQYYEACTDAGCANGCFCTNIQEFPDEKTVQLVLMSYEPGAKYMTHHVAHLHGYNFAVLAIGYPPQNQTTAQWTGLNPDITCDDASLWRCQNPFWTGFTPPTLNTVNPPIKDSVLIPARGYVVVRFKTDNQGYWMLRNMRELPYSEGMWAVLKVGKPPKPPKGFPECVDFNWDAEDFEEYTGDD